MNLNKSKATEYILLILLFLVLITSILFDTVLSQYIPKMFISQDNDFRGLMIVVYQIQASVSTLAIALIAILSSVSNEVVYGISVSKYILQLKPNILKHKTIIFIELILILINYIFISYKFYSTTIGVFIISILLLLYMVNAIFIVFNGKNHIKGEVYEYIITIAKSAEKLSKTGTLDSLEKDIDDAIESNSSYRTKEDLNILIEIFSIVFNDIIVNKDLKKYWEALFEKLFKLFLGSSSNVLEKNQVYKYIHKINEVIISKYDSNSKFAFWDKFSREYFNSMSIRNIREYKDTYIYSLIRRDLYNTLFINERRERKNNYFLEYYSSQVYIKLIKNNNYKVLSKNEMKRLKVKLFKDIIIQISNLENYKNKVTEILYSELLDYTKTLIDNFEKEIIEESFIDAISLYKKSDINELNYYYTIIIYLYYLSEEEKLIDVELKEFSKKITSENFNSISSFLISDHYLKINNSDSISSINNTLDKWEFMPEKEAKFLIMDSCITSFLIYNTLYRERNIISLTEKLKPIVLDNGFSIYDEYVGRNKLNSRTKYKKFVEMFYRKKINDEELDNHLCQLESSIATIYKIKDIENSENKKLSDDNRIIAEKQLLEKVKVKINNILSFFKGNKTKEKCKFKTFKFSIGTFSQFFNEDDIDIYIDSMSTWFINVIIKLIIKHLDYEEISFRRKDLLNIFFDLLSTSQTEVDTIIGYKNWFYGVHNEAEFKEFEERMKKIYDSKLSNIIATIDSRKVNIVMTNSSVKIQDIDALSIIKNLRKNDEGLYLYNITSDIYLPFEEEELRKYLQNTKKNIEFEITLEYLILEKKVGIAVINNRE